MSIEREQTLDQIIEQIAMYNPELSNKNSTELVMIATQLFALRVVLLKKIPEVLRTAAKSDPSDFLAYLSLAKFYTYDLPDETQSQHFLKCARNNLSEKETNFDEYRSDLDLVERHWTENS